MKLGRSMPARVLSIVAAALLVAGCAQADSPAAKSSAPTATPAASATSAPATSAAAGAIPQPVEALTSKGLKIDGSLAAPAGFHGYLAEYQGQPIPVYLLPDGQHVVIGTLYDAHGNDLTLPAMREVVGQLGPKLGAAQWDQLAKSSWFVAGNPHAKRVVYAFMDTRCPFCHRMWVASQPLLKQGHVQLRIILVAVIAPASLPEGAEVLGARDPLQAWARNEKDFGHNADPKPNAGSALSRAKLQANTRLFAQLGFPGTPTVVYKDADGKVQAIPGDPPPQLLKTILGAR